MVKTMHVPTITTQSDNGKNGVFSIEPLHRGYGITIGNSMRRVLLSSLEGAAVTAYALDGVNHEFSSLEGVKEDVVQVTLNIKKLRFRSYSDEPQTIEITKKGKGVVTAKDIKNTADIEIANPEQHIATLDNAKANFHLTLRIEKGRGYSPVEERRGEDYEVGMIAVDAMYSPVERVRYRVEHTRVGQQTDLDKLVIDVNTDGTLSPTEAIQQSAATLVSQFAVISGESRPTFDTESTDATGDEPSELNFSIEDLGFSPRTANALTNNEITNVRDLIELSDNDLKTLKGFGAKAYQEVLDKLKELELR